MKNRNRALLLLLAAAYAAGVFIGCSQSSDTKKAPLAVEGASGITAAGVQEDNFSEPMEVTMAYWDGQTAFLEGVEDPVYEQIKKKFNLTFKARPVTWSNYFDKINLWVSSGDVPDFFAVDAVGRTAYRNWIAQGVVRALPENMDRYPNLQRILSLPDIQALKQNDKLYCIPRVAYKDFRKWMGDRAILVRSDWMKKAGFAKEPETLEELIALGKAFIQRDPDGNGKDDTIGLVTQSYWYLQAIGTAYNPTLDNWVKEDGRWIPGYASKKQLEMLKAYRRLYSEGVLDKDFAVSKDDKTDTFAAGRAGIFLYASVPHIFKQIKDKFVKYNPDKRFEDCVAVLKPLKAPDGKYYGFTTYSYWSESYFASKVSGKKMDRLMRLFDFLVSEEGLQLCRYGIEGTDYTVRNGNITVTRPKDRQNDVYKALGDIYPITRILGFIVTWDQDFYYEDSATYGKDLLRVSKDALDWSLENCTVPEINYVVNYISTPAKEQLNIQPSDDAIKIILGKEEVDKMWADLMDQYTRDGMQKAMDEVNVEAEKLGVR